MGRRRRYWDGVWGVVLLLCWVLVMAPRVHAHGGGKIVVGNAALGDFLATVWVNPFPAHAGNTMHVTVSLAETLEGGTPGMAVVNQLLTFTLASKDGGEIVRFFPSHEASSNKFLYEADGEAPAAGVWEATLMAEDGATITFDLVVEEPPLLSVRAVLLASAGVFFVALPILWRRAKTRREASTDASYDLR